MWKKKTWQKILSLAIIFSIIGTLANMGVISIDDGNIDFVLKQLMYIGCIIVAVCAINYNKIKK